MKCYNCNESDFKEVLIDYKARTADDNVVVINKLSILKCPSCGEELIPADSQEKIEKVLNESLDLVSNAELNAFLEKYHLDQKTASESLGLGEKTFHRWLRGTQKVSRSMSFFIRTMHANPVAYSWLKERTWKSVGGGHGQADYWQASRKDRFPSMNVVDFQYLPQSRANSAKALLESVQ